jgi:hypothetical protein
VIKVLRYIAIIIACGVIIALIVKFRSCGSDGLKSGTTTVPADRNFSPVTHQEYQPPSTPLSKRKLPVTLPAGVKERDVKKVTSVTVHNVPNAPPKTINIIETKAGETFVEKDSSILSVTTTDIQPPFFVIDLRFGGGITADFNHISPAAVIALIEWSGWLQAPIVLADIDGIAAGAQARLYHDIFIGAVHEWRFDQTKQSKLTMNFMF